MTANRRNGLLASLLFASALLSAPAHAQGCIQCADQLRATPARVQNAYRRAILLMVIAGGGIFTGAVLTLRRFR